MSTVQAPVTEAALQAEAGTDQYLTFILAGEEYGVDILRVQEIRGWGPVTPIPNCPSYVLGVINLRGAIVPIVDLRKRFYLDEATFGPATVVIVLKAVSNERERTVGFVVDGVSEVYNVPESEIKPPPDFDGKIDMEFVKGLTTVSEKMVILLDTDSLLDLQ